MRSESFKSCCIKFLFHLVTTVHLGHVCVGTAAWFAGEFWKGREERHGTLSRSQWFDPRGLVLGEMSRNMQVSALWRVLLGNRMRLLAWMADFVPSTQPEQPQGKRKGAKVMESECQVIDFSTV